MCVTKGLSKLSVVAIDVNNNDNTKPALTETDSDSDNDGAQSTDSSCDDNNNNSSLAQVLQDLQHQQDALGESHVNVADTYNSLGLMRLHMQKNAQEAIACHLQALRIYTLYSDTIVNQAVTLQDLGYCHERCNQPKVALGYYQQAVQLLVCQGYPPEHSRIVSAQRSIYRLSRA